MVKVKNLVWDSWNIDHIARHNVVKEEVFEIVQDESAVWSETYRKRKRIIGKTKKRRLVTAILAEKNRDSLYTITARPASRKERRIYDKSKE